MIARPTTVSPWSSHHILLFAAVVSAVTPDRAGAAPRQTTITAAEREIARCIKQASAGKPWLERTLWGLRDQEGGWVGAEISNRDGSHDLGPLQVNSWWVPKLAAATGRSVAQVRWWLTEDPCFNIEAARWIFLSGLSATRDYWKAVGIYHSPSVWRQRIYSASVARHLQRRFGSGVFRQ